jgi:hypothetical protein
MKRLAIFLALMIIPCSAFGLEMLNDSTMDGITGQAGVQIAMDDVQLFLNIEKLAWIDCDGFSTWEGKACGGYGGALVLNNFQIDVLNINAITGQTGTSVNGGVDLHSLTCGDIPLFYDYATSAALPGCRLTTALAGQNLGLNNYWGKDTASGTDKTNWKFVPHFLTIDVTDRLPASSEGLQTWFANGWTNASVAAGGGTATSTFGGVLIGIPTMEIYINELSFTPVYDGDITGGTPGGSSAINDDNHPNTISYGHETSPAYATFGTIYMQGITFTTLSGWIEISPK